MQAALSGSQPSSQSSQPSNHALLQRRGRPITAEESLGLLQEIPGQPQEGPGLPQQSPGQIKESPGPPQESPGTCADEHQLSHRVAQTSHKCNQIGLLGAVEIFSSMDVTIYRMCRAVLATDKRYVIRKTRNASRISNFYTRPLGRPKQH